VVNESGANVRDGAAADDPIDSAAYPDALANGLLSPFGVIGRMWRRDPPAGLPGYTAYGCSAGWAVPGTRRTRVQSVAGGNSFDDGQHARTVCLAEGAERYCSGARTRDDYPSLRAAELDGAVLDMTALPACSPTELADPACTVRPYDPDQPIRWAAGLDLRDGSRCWVPAVLANYRLADRGPNELFNYPISSGYAVHRDFRSAVVNAILEVIERDMVAVIWLQMLQLPRIDHAVLGPAAARAVDWADDNFLDIRLFDATSDLGVPTVYGVLIAPYDHSLRTWVSCSTSYSLASAADKVVREVLASRSPSLAARSAAPESIDDIESVLDGAFYMAQPDRRHAFDFLTRPDAPVSSVVDDLPSDAGALLELLRDRLADTGMQAVVVDQTTSELIEVGLRAVNVVIPQLQPMSLLPHTRFLAHPRLYELPAALGYPVHREQELNPWPQPFP
jgi:ribosomal protein S12 methylthiotransferase accessory factor